MWRRIGLSFLYGAAFFGPTFALSQTIVLAVISKIDFGLYVRLRGRTMATPDWEPWSGWYILQAATAAVGLTGAIDAGWIALAKDGVITNSGRDSDAKARDNNAL